MSCISGEFASRGFDLISGFQLVPIFPTLILESTAVDDSRLVVLDSIAICPQGALPAFAFDLSRCVSRN
ncbi:hypothetical protein SAMN05216428_11554 [Nitrosospira sp. Nsp11]|nr:hypothetical protein SAMN05216428_11554 [Nitrosospira sp. Nsp11]